MQQHLVRKHGDRGKQSETAAHVLEVLRICAEPDGTVSLSQSSIARKMNVGQTAVAVALKWLMDNKLIKMERKPKFGVATVYRVVGMTGMTKQVRPSIQWYEEAAHGKGYHRSLNKVRNNA